MNNLPYRTIGGARRGQNIRGVTLVEAAVGLFVFFLFLFSAVEFCRYLWLSNALKTAAQKALTKATYYNKNSGFIEIPLETAFTVNHQVITEINQVAINALGAGFSNGSSSKAKLVGAQDLVIVNLPDPAFDTADAKVVIGLPIDPDGTRRTSLISNPIGVRLNAEFKPLTAFLPAITVSGEAWGYREPPANSAFGNGASTPCPPGTIIDPANPTCACASPFVARPDSNGVVRCTCDPALAVKPTVNAVYEDWIFDQETCRYDRQCPFSGGVVPWQGISGVCGCPQSSAIDYVEMSKAIYSVRNPFVVKPPDQGNACRTECTVESGAPLPAGCDATNTCGNSNCPGDRVYSSKWCGCVCPSGTFVNSNGDCECMENRVTNPDPRRGCSCDSSVVCTGDRHLDGTCNCTCLLGPGYSNGNPLTNTDACSCDAGYEPIKTGTVLYCCPSNKCAGMPNSHIGAYCNCECDPGYTQIGTQCLDRSITCGPESQGENC